MKPYVYLFILLSSSSLGVHAQEPDYSKRNLASRILMIFGIAGLAFVVLAMAVHYWFDVNIFVIFSVFKCYRIIKSRLQQQEPVTATIGAEEMRTFTAHSSSTNDHSYRDNNITASITASEQPDIQQGADQDLELPPPPPYSPPLPSKDNNNIDHVVLNIDSNSNQATTSSTEASPPSYNTPPRSSDT
jgi:hypothetical protein